jgi:kumamolisin
MVPDVAANADPQTGYQIFLKGGATVVGGTSAVAPLYAGLFASFGQKLGYATLKLYQNPSAFVPITTGSNGAFSATPGVNPVAGLGVPIGTALAALF